MDNKILLDIRDLHASVDGKEILKGINLTIREGEVHAIMGPNGSGKSTLSMVLAGAPGYTVTGGEVDFHGKQLLELTPEDRSHEGLFLSFQYPVEIPGVSMVNFMRAAVNEKRKYFNEEPLSASDFLKLMRQKRAIVELDNKLASRSVNASQAAKRNATKSSKWLSLSLVCQSSTKPTQASTSTRYASLQVVSTN
jgi:Fe-S cluster assembly ATP-binding protein